MLLNIPSDALVKLLHILEVQDILLVESTCRSLRQYIMHDARHLWLTKLNELDPSCAPDMPHNISVESLTCEELRNIVIKAVRQYWALMNSSASKPIFCLKNRIPLNCPRLNFASRFQSRIIPGGRYIFVYWTALYRITYPLSSHSWTQDFYIVDMKDSNRRVWSYENEENQDGDTLHAFEYKVRRDGTIILVVLDRIERADLTADSFFRVFGLSLESESGTFRETLVYTLPCSYPFHTDLTAQIHYPISDDFVILLDPGINLILSLKWDEKKVAKIRSTRFTALRHFRIWQDHLFYIDTERQELRATPLSELFDRRLNEDSLVELDHLSCTTLSIHELRDRNGIQPIAASSRETLYSIYDTPWRNDSTAIFTITLQAWIYDHHFTTIRARFSSDGSADWRWTVLSVRTAVDRYECTRSIRILPDMTRSGRIFAHDSWERIGICAVDRQGCPVVAVPPMEIDQLLQTSDTRPVLRQEAHRRLLSMGLILARIRKWTKKRFNRFNETFVRTGFDEYLGSLAIVRRTASERYTLEIYHPV